MNQLALEASHNLYCTTSNAHTQITYDLMYKLLTQASKLEFMNEIDTSWNLFIECQIRINHFCYMHTLANSISFHQRIYSDIFGTAILQSCHTISYYNSITVWTKCVLFSPNLRWDALKEFAVFLIKYHHLLLFQTSKKILTKNKEYYIISYVIQVHKAKNKWKTQCTPKIYLIKTIYCAFYI